MMPSALTSTTGRAACLARPATLVHLPARPAQGMAGTLRRVTVALSGNGEPDRMSVPKISMDDAFKLLDVRTGAGFEEVLQAKNRKMALADGDISKVMQIEDAYDMLFSASLKARITGDNVNPSVRFADVQSVRREPPQKAGSSGRGSRANPSGGRSMGRTVQAPGGLQLAVPRDTQLLTQQSAVFSGLAVWSLLQAVTETDTMQLQETAGLQLALALGYSIYTLKENKKMDLGKAVGVSVACLFAGALLGTALQQWLRVDIVPIGAFASPGVFCTEWAIILLALGAIFVL